MLAAWSSTLCACCTICSPSGVTVTSPALVLELLDGHREGRLGDVAGLGRLAEVPFAGYCDDVFEFGESHSLRQLCASLRDPALSGGTAHPRMRAASMLG